MPARRHIALFFGINLLLCSWHLYDGPNDNIMSRATMTDALARHGTLRIDAYGDRTADVAVIDGHRYSDKAPLPAFLVLPFWKLIMATRMEEGTLSPRLLRLGGLLCGSVPLALIITLLWLHLARAPMPDGLPPALLATLPVYGSFLFIFSGAWFAHLLAAIFTLLALRAFQRHTLAAAGGWAGAAACCDYPVALFPLFWLLLLLVRGDGRGALRMALGALPWAIALLVYNTVLTGHPFSLGYGHEAPGTPGAEGFGFTFPRPVALWGLSFSDYRGLFFYLPVLPVALAAALTARDRKPILTDPVWIPALLCFLLIASVGMWWGGWSYGPRHLTTVAVLLLYRTLPSLAARRSWRWAVALATAFGLACALLAKDTRWFAFPTEVAHPLGPLLQAWGDHTPMQIPALLGMPPAVASALFLLALACGIFALHRLERTAPSPDASLLP